MEQQVCRGIRKRSEKALCGLPLVDIAIGSDPEKNDMRGHAHGIIAIGDIAKVGLHSAVSPSVASRSAASRCFPCQPLK